MKIDPKMSEEAVRKMYSGFLPAKIAAQLIANKEPTEEQIAAARALIAKAEGKRGPGRPRAVEAAE
jgi:hypothetical protein